MTREDRRERERGLALVSMLWGVSILSLIAASMISAGTISYAIERNALKRAEADAIADSAIALAILGLLDPRPEKRWRVDGVPHEVSFAGTPIEITIQDVFGLIDLNEADAGLLAGLFRGAGLAPDEAARIAARIVDWRTVGDRHSLDGATRADYRAAGFAYAPRGGPFQSVDELKLVLGMTPVSYAAVAPALTVYSRQPSFDPRLAPREALLALPQIDERQANVAIAERLANAGTVSNRGLTLPVGIIDPTLSMNGRAFAIRAELAYRGTRIAREATIRVTGDRARPYLVMAWN